jgi:hypothetical protein
MHLGSNCISVCLHLCESLLLHVYITAASFDLFQVCFPAPYPMFPGLLRLAIGESKRPSPLENPSLPTPSSEIPFACYTQGFPSLPFLHLTLLPFPSAASPPSHSSSSLILPKLRVTTPPISRLPTRQINILILLLPLIV